MTWQSIIGSMTKLHFIYPVTCASSGIFWPPARLPAKIYIVLNPTSTGSIYISLTQSDSLAHKWLRLLWVTRFPREPSLTSTPKISCSKSPFIPSPPVKRSSSSVFPVPSLLLAGTNVNRQWPVNFPTIFLF